MNKDTKYSNLIVFGYLAAGQGEFPFGGALRRRVNVHKLGFGRGALEAAAAGAGVHNLRRLLQVGLNVSNRSAFDPDGYVVGVQRMLNAFDLRQLSHKFHHSQIQK